MRELDFAQLLNFAHAPVAWRKASIPRLPSRSAISGLGGTMGGRGRRRHLSIRKDSGWGGLRRRRAVNWTEVEQWQHWVVGSRWFPSGLGQANKKRACAMHGALQEVGLGDLGPLL